MEVFTEMGPFFGGFVAILIIFLGLSSLACGMGLVVDGADTKESIKSFFGNPRDKIAWWWLVMAIPLSFTHLYVLSSGIYFFITGSPSDIWMSFVVAIACVAFVLPGAVAVFIWSWPLLVWVSVFRKDCYAFDN